MMSLVRGPRPLVAPTRRHASAPTRSAPRPPPHGMRSWLTPRRAALVTAASGGGGGPVANSKRPDSSGAAPKLMQRPARPQGPGGPQGEQPPPPPGSRLPPQLLRLMALLTQYGGVYGTAAVMIAWVAKVDAFGNLHWSTGDVLTGLSVFAPLLLLDFALMWPDYSVTPGEARSASSVILGPELAGIMDAEAATLGQGSKKGAARAADGVPPPAGAEAAAEAAAPLALDEPGIAMAKAPTTDDERAAAVAAVAAQQRELRDGAAAPAEPRQAPGAVEAAWIRLRMALELFQNANTRRNPGALLHPASELVVILVGELTNEMLYRAVMVTLLGFWIRDRLFEAGLDDVVGLAGGEVATSDLARFAAVALIGMTGAAAFVAQALRERQMLERVALMARDGVLPTERADVIKQQLIMSMGTQNTLVYGMECVRAVGESLMAGWAFVLTGNLAAPYAGKVVTQALFSAYQRAGIARAMQKRKALMARMLARSARMEAALSAAVGRARGGAAGADAPATDAAASEGGSDRGGSGGEGSAAAGAAADASADVGGADTTVQHWGQAGGTGEASAPAAADGGAAAAGEAFRAAMDAAAARQAPTSTAPPLASGDEASRLAPAAPSAAAAERSGPAPEVEDLLVDMMRSPEGQQLIARMMQHSTDGPPGPADTMAYTERMLGDPATKAALLGQLEARLLEMAAVTENDAE